MAPRTPQSTPAELSLVNLKNCLVNLPPSLATLLSNVNTPVQNVVVSLFPAARGSIARPVYLGWTGLPSRRKATPLGAAGRNDGGRGGHGAQSLDLPLVEIDTTLGRTLGLADGQRVTVAIHVDPPLVHTVNIEPLTPEDWEMVELHAQFLELNLLAQMRAVPNPAYAPGGGVPAAAPHPLTLHLTPTSTAAIRVTGIEPSMGAEVPFAKISPDAEFIVAPKTRAQAQAQATRNGGDHHSVTSTARSAKSGAAARKKSEERAPLFLRGLDSASCRDWFGDDVAVNDFSVWLDSELATREWKGVKYVLVHVLRPVGIQVRVAQREGQNPAQPDHQYPATRLVAKLRPWDDPPNGQAVALSPAVCGALGCVGMVGGVVKVQAAPESLANTSVRALRVFPFLSTAKVPEGLRFGGDSKAEKEEAAKAFRAMYAGTKQAEGILTGPLTDGVVLAPFDGLSAPPGWEGGIVKVEFDGGASSVHDPDALNWTANLDPSIPVAFQAPTPRPAWMLDADPFDRCPTHDSPTAGIDDLLAGLQTQLLHGSSTLLTGAMGSGKTSVARLVAQRLRTEHLHSTFYFACATLVSDDTPTARIRETVSKLFMAAAWGARLGGKALVVLDDLHKLCKAESELQVGNENSRNRLISEVVCGIVRQHAGAGVVLLATAESKDALDGVVVGGHVVRDIVELKAPDREGRRKVLETIVRRDTVTAAAPPPGPLDTDTADGNRPGTADRSFAEYTAGWIDGGGGGDGDGHGNASGGFVLEPDLDFLDVAALTDGYMPGDLKVLVARAQKEAILRSITGAPSSSSSSDLHIPLARVDFDRALRGFTPASLRNVSLQSSSTTFASIGGLRETRRVLLETLEYPTRYAPIFARCPLRLRSGLLLYGYPGCGKTLLASAVAGECGLNFISVKGPEILNKYIGASEKSVRDLFARAQAARPCVLFLDEFDSIAPRRGHDSTGVTDRVVNQLLVQMDGAEGLSGVYVLAATSRPDLIDPALLRPGRLDKALLCDLPDLADRMDILAALSSQMRLADDLTVTDDAFEEIARRTEGFTGADLAALVGNAQLAAIRCVLHDESEHPGASSRGRTSGRTRASGAGSHPSSFVQFRYGGRAGTERGTLAETAEIRSKLEDLRMARKRAREARRGPSVPPVSGSEPGAGAAGGEVVVGWQHVMEALAETGPSMSVAERRRLLGIYAEFFTGRSGEMKDGQGSMEVGGRSSLA